MNATNQGFIDLHNPLGFMLIGLAFLVFTVLIAAGAIFSKRLAARDRERRAVLKKEMQDHKTTET